MFNFRQKQLQQNFNEVVSRKPHVKKCKDVLNISYCFPLNRLSESGNLRTKVTVNRQPCFRIIEFVIPLSFTALSGSIVDIRL